MLKYINLLLVAVGLLYASVIEHRLSGVIDYSYINSSENNANQLDMVINNDMYLDDHRLTASPGFYLYDRSSYNRVVKEDVSKIRAIYLNELFYTYSPDERLSLSIGLFPFRKGSLYEHSFNNNKIGMGLYTITDAVLQGIILTYKNDYTIQLGTVAYERYFKSFKDYDEGDGPLTLDSYRKSGIDYLMYKNKYNKFNYELYYMYMYQYVLNKEIINTDSVSLAVSYDDEDVSGRVYYGILSASKSEGDTSPLINNVEIINKDTHFGSFETSGYYFLLGIKQEYDNALFGKDVMLGFEYSYRNRGYHSLLAGRPLSPHSYGDIGSFYNAFVGIRVTRDFLIKARYFKYDSGNVSIKRGMSPVYGKNIINDKSNHKHDAFVLQLYYDF